MYEIKQTPLQIRMKNTKLAILEAKSKPRKCLGSVVAHLELQYELLFIEHEMLQSS